MAENLRSGCLRTFFGGSRIGSFIGPMAGFVIATIDAPPVDPAYEPSGEWFTPFMRIVILPLSRILAAFVGAFG